MDTYNVANANKRVGLLALAVIAMLQPGLANAFGMYCPRANIKFHSMVVNQSSDGEAEYLLALGGAALRFPRNLEDLKGQGGDMEGISFKFTDCSDSEFLCKRVIQSNWEDPKLSYVLIVPRRIEAGHEYWKNDVHIIARTAMPHWAGKEPLLQVTLWQKIEGQDRPMELSFATKRGVVYWDGIQFNAADGAQPEICLLTTDKGMFSDVKIVGGRR